jgi:hypothetical protein
MPKPSEKSAADMFDRAGRALYPGDDWQIRLAREIGVRRDTVRQWLSGHMTLRRDHFATLLRLLAERQSEMRRAEAELQAWLAGHPDDLRPGR